MLEFTSLAWVEEPSRTSANREKLLSTWRSVAHEGGRVSLPMDTTPVLDWYGGLLSDHVADAPEAVREGADVLVDDVVGALADLEQR